MTTKTPVELEGERLVGLGATLLYPQDRYPLVVIDGTKSRKTLVVKRVRDVGGDTGHKPARYDGPWPVWDHTYSVADLARFQVDGSEQKIHWSEKHQCYRLNGTPVSVGSANYYRNYSY